MVIEMVPLGWLVLVLTVGTETAALAQSCPRPAWHSETSETPVVAHTAIAPDRPGPDTAQDGQPLTATQLTPAGYVAAMQLLTAPDSVHGLHPVIRGHLTMRRDSVLMVVDSLVRAWLIALHHGSLVPRDFLNLAALHARVGHDTEVQREIATWLASPGVTTRDSVIAYGMAVHFFLETDTDAPPPVARLQYARAYEACLEAMPMSQAVAGQLFGVRTEMMEAYANAGETDSAITNGLRAYALLRRMPAYEDRAMYAASEAMIGLARELAGRPAGLRQIDSLITMLKHEIAGPPALLAQDTALKRFAYELQEQFDANAEQLRWLGHQAPPLIATHWLNQSTPPTVSAAAPGARVLALDDGIIRIVGFGWFTCPACHFAMSSMQRDQGMLLRGVQLLYYEWTSGSWGNKLVDPETEVLHLKDFWLTRKRYTLPIAVWAGPKDSTPDGGLLPRPSPTATALHIHVGPTIYVIDGHGIVRHWEYGYNGWSHLASIINRLIAERDHERDHAAAPVLVDPAAPLATPPAAAAVQ